MQGNIEKRGRYELFETSKGHQILCLNDKDFYAVVEGQKGDLLVRSDSDHKKKKTVKKGKFYLADFDEDPEFQDTPHLFLEESKSLYQEWILPRGAPTSGDYQKKLIRTDNKVQKDKVDYHVKGSGDKGREKQYQGTRNEAHSRSEAAGHGGRKKGNGQADLMKKTRGELYDMAKQRQINGRSSMDKAELADALSKQ